MNEWMVGWLVNCMLYEEYLKNTLKCCHFKSYYYPTTIEKTKNVEDQKCKVMHLLFVEDKKSKLFLQKIYWKAKEKLNIRVLPKPVYMGVI